TEQELRRQVAEAGIADRVGFIPFQRDTAAIYRMLDVVVHASTRPEPFGMTVVEAMSCGRPVIVSAAGGACELFQDGVDAVGFEPGSVQQLVSLIVKLARDPDLRRQLGKNGRRSAVSRFSLDRLANDLRRELLALLPGLDGNRDMAEPDPDVVE